MHFNGIPAEIEVIRSNRKTIQINFYADGRMVLRVPLKCPDTEISRFLTDNRDKITKYAQDIRQKRDTLDQYPPFTMAQINQMADLALKWIPERVKYFAAKMGVTYHRITIRNQKTRWGSCSSDGNLNFNCLLMEMPENVRDSVIIHELAHRRHMNHSAAFYKEVYAVMPKTEYDECRRYLKTQGSILMDRMKRCSE